MYRKYENMSQAISLDDSNVQKIEDIYNIQINISKLN